MSKITVVTTCNQKGYEGYGRKMLETFSQFWEKDIALLFYKEDCVNLPKIPNVVYLDFPAWFLSWKEKHRDNEDAHGRKAKRNRGNRAYDFRRDCIKFSHKIAAITDAAKRVNTDLLIWLDADTITHEKVTSSWLSRLNTSKAYLAWLARDRVYPECGFLIFDCRSSSHSRFLQLLRSTYEEDKVFGYKETHDSYIFQELVKDAVREGWMKKPFSLSGKHSSSHHVFVMSILGSKLDHAKGARKRLGRTAKVEVKRRRQEAYWR